jgi:glycosyltransferase involved in cell wall biosynthesis
MNERPHTTCGDVGVSPSQPVEQPRASHVEHVAECPLISVVTASYNQGQYIEETIRSVLEQDYPHVEYLVIDGASTDGTLDVLKKYDGQLDFWVSEPDDGPASAINRGFRMAKGDILCWINSDDWYYPGALAAAAREFGKSRDTRWVSGRVNNGTSADWIVRRHTPRPMSLVECIGRHDYAFHQPGMFWHREMFETCGPFDESLQFCFDHHFWIHAIEAGYQSVDIEDEIAFFRVHAGSKSFSQMQHFVREDWLILKQHERLLSPRDRVQARRWLRTYEASYLVDIAYSLVGEVGRTRALFYLLKRLPLLRYVPKLRPVLGATARILLKGRSPDWWKRSQFPNS